MANEQLLCLLQRIAGTLDVPVATFLNPSASKAEKAALPGAREVQELLEAFAQVADPKARCDCIEFVRRQRFPSQP
jgi:hypothetical protein